MLASYLQIFVLINGTSHINLDRLSYLHVPKMSSIDNVYVDLIVTNELYKAIKITRNRSIIMLLFRCDFDIIQE